MPLDGRDGRQMSSIDRGHVDLKNIQGHRFRPILSTRGGDLDAKLTTPIAVLLGVGFGGLYHGPPFFKVTSNDITKSFWTDGKPHNRPASLKRSAEGRPRL